jgi:hypothetical protein
MSERILITASDAQRRRRRASTVGSPTDMEVSR